MHRFFALIENDEVRLTESDAFHLFSVLHVEKNEHIEVVYNDELYECVVLELVPLKIKVLNKMKDNHEFPFEVTLYMGLTKKDKPDIVLERACELGVKEIVLVDCERSVVKLDEEQLIKRLARYSRILKSASEQSKRMQIPEVTYIPFKSVFAYQELDYLFLGHATSKETIKEFPNFKKGDRIGLIIGPEGGFSNKELELAVKNNVQFINFSSQVLRAEVASISALSIINYLGNKLV